MKFLFEKTVTINNCSNPFSWYKKRIGKSFKVTYANKKIRFINNCDEYLTLDDIAGKGNKGFIKKSDTEKK